MKKIQEKIYAIFQTLKSYASKLRISSFVGGQFKKRQYNNYRDFNWYYQHSWFDRKWFKHKLIRIIMRNVYKFTDKLDDVLFKKYHETYYVEFKIILNDSGLLIGEIPLLLKIKNGDDIEHIIRLLFGEIKKSVGYDIMITSLKRLINDDDIEHVKNQIELRFESFSAIGKITFLTGLINPKINIDNVTPFTIDPNEIPMGYELLRKDIIEFGVIETKNKRNYINHEDTFQILIKFEKNIKKVIDEEPKEIRIDRIKELMGLKIDNIDKL